MQIWRDGEADKLTQLVFCDISTPQAKAPASKAAKTLDNPLLHALEGAVGGTACRLRVRAGGRGDFAAGPST